MRDYESYYKRMGSNMLEKLDYILPHLSKFDIVVDFGCANGMTTELMAAEFPNINFLGIDLAPIVRNNNANNEPVKNVAYMTVGDYIELGVERAIHVMKVGVIFSSVTHELFSFLGLEDSIELVFNTFNADTIFIRDMYCEADYTMESTLLKDNYTEEFEEKWGFNSGKDIAHFLLKVRYKNNWEEELREDYFATDWEAIIDLGAAKEYKVTYDESYMNEYLHGKIIEEEGEDLKEYTNTTHRKLILER